MTLEKAMRSIITRGFLIAAAASTLMACAEDVPELFIVQNNTLDDQCQIRNAASEVAQSIGFLDLFVTNQYIMYPVVENVLVGADSVTFNTGSGGGEGISGTDWEANRITLTRASVEFDAPAALGVPLPSDFTIPLSGGLAPGDAATVGLQVVSASIGNTLATSPLLQQRGSTVTILLRVKFFGVTAAGREIDSNLFTYPVQLCVGCLLDVPAEAIDPAFPTPNCRITEGFDSNLNDVCTPGQDEPIDCRAVCPLVQDIDEEDPTGICIPL